MKKFYLAIAVSMFFYVMIDILIWQRIFETLELWDVGIGTYHHGWRFALYGFAALGVIMFWPDKRKAIAFPLTLAILSQSGLPDILYYWLDGRALPETLPWLDWLPTLWRPVTDIRLLVSASFWIIAVIVFNKYLVKA